MPEFERRSSSRFGPTLALATPQPPLHLEQGGGAIDARDVLLLFSTTVLPTRSGARWCGWEGGISHPPLAVLAHELTAAAVRIRRYPPQLGWRYVTERQFVQIPVEFGEHRPDAVAKLGERSTAIEIQLSVTDQERLTRVLSNHLLYFDEVHYWGTSTVGRLLHRTVEERIPDHEAGRIGFTELGELMRS